MFKKRTENFEKFPPHYEKIQQLSSRGIFFQIQEEPMKDRKMNISLESEEWMDADLNNAGRSFTGAGFKNTEEVLELRIYDMLNILGIDRIRAEEMVQALYYFFNENRKADDALYLRLIDQYFDFRRWHMEHPDYTKVTVKDLVLTEGMNRDALEWLFDQVVRKFWKSEEYNSREYRYYSYRDLISKMEEGEMK